MKEKNEREEQDPTFEFDICNACSTTDCTGLIPAAPASEAEYESYEALYHFLPPQAHVSEKADALKGIGDTKIQDPEKARAKEEEDKLRGRMELDNLKG